MVFMLSSFSSVGFSGSRTPNHELVSAAKMALSRVNPDALVMVGCAKGIDAIVRSEVDASRLKVFSVYGTGKGAFAERSIRCVRAVFDASGTWVSLPSGPCPSVLRPSDKPTECFCGTGSGSWASLALAKGLGVPCLVFLSDRMSPPNGWGFRPLKKGWFLAE